MTQKERNASCVGLLMALVGLLGLALFSHREPTYQGKPLREWAQQYGANHWSGTDRAPDKEAEFAIQQVGTNAIPFLLGMMRARDSALKKKLRTIVPEAWHEDLHLRDSSDEVRRVGAHGLAALGTNATAVVPALIELAR